LARCGARREQLAWRVGHAGPLDQVVDEYHGRPQRGRDEQGDEPERDIAQPPSLLTTGRVARDQYDEENGFERRKQPGHADRRLLRQPEVQSDIEGHEDDDRGERRPARFAEEQLCVVVGGGR